MCIDHACHLVLYTCSETFLTSSASTLSSMQDLIRCLGESLSLYWRLFLLQMMH
jgi:hypothetical protein